MKTKLETSVTSFAEFIGNQLARIRVLLNAYKFDFKHYQIKYDPKLN